MCVDDDALTAAWPLQTLANVLESKLRDVNIDMDATSILQACTQCNGVSKYLYPQVPVPTYIYIDYNVNFEVLKNREDSSDFDDFQLEIIVTTRSIV